MNNRANRIAKALRAKARRKRIKSYKRIPARDDFRQAIREAYHRAEMEAAQ